MLPQGSGFDALLKKILLQTRMEKINAAIVGCGNVATHYAEQIQNYKQVNLVGFSDLDQDRAKAFALKYGGKVYPTLDEVLSDPSIDFVVNLTIHHAHFDVITQCLNRGKHVHSEKPLALSYAETKQLVDLARKKNLRLSSAPTNFMGDAQQTAWKILREGKLGKVRLAYAEINHGRIETWHPNPEPFYEVGILWDVSVYPLTYLTTLFGRVSQVRAFGKVIYPDRKTMEGNPFHIETPDCVFAIIEFDCGLIARMTANFYAKNAKERHSIEMHGDKGSLYLGNFQEFNSSVEYADYGEEYESIPYLKTPFEGHEVARGVEEFADAILSEKPHRATGARAAHIVETVEAIGKAVETGSCIPIHSNFTPPEPMDWAR